MLNKTGKSRHPCLVSDLRGKASAFHCECDVSCGLAFYGLYYSICWGTSTLYPLCLESCICDLDEFISEDSFFGVKF